MRHKVPRRVDIAFDPLTWTRFRHKNTVTWTRAGLTVVDRRLAVDRELKALDRSATDPYATLRSGYRQRRQAEIENRNDRATPAATGAGLHR